MSNLIHLIRRASQVFGLLITNLYGSVFFRKQIYKGPFKGVCVPFLYCHACPTAVFSCPIGELQHYAAVHLIPFYLIGHLTFIGLFVGRMACGWLCPFGLLQELMYKIKSFKIKIPSYFSYLPWFCLFGLAILLPYLTTEHWFSKLCPIGALVAGIPWVLWNPVNPVTGGPTIEPGSVSWLFFIKMFLLVGTLYLFVLAKRPFCRYVCPLGLFWGFFNKISILKLEVAPGCRGCNMCQNLCPEDIKVFEEPNSRECVRCLECLKCKHVKLVGYLPFKTEIPINTKKICDCDVEKGAVKPHA